MREDGLGVAEGRARTVYLTLELFLNSGVFPTPFLSAGDPPCPL